MWLKPRDLNLLPTRPVNACVGHGLGLCIVTGTSSLLGHSTPPKLYRINCVRVRAAPQLFWKRWVSAVMLPVVWNWILTVLVRAVVSRPTGQYEMRIGSSPSQGFFFLWNYPHFIAQLELVWQRSACSSCVWDNILRCSDCKARPVGRSVKKKTFKNWERRENGGCKIGFKLQNVPGLCQEGGVQDQSIENIYRRLKEVLKIHFY